MPRTHNRIYRRPGSPFWWASYVTAQGEPVRCSTGCRERGAADAWLAARELERQRAAMGIASARPIRLVTAALEYLDARKSEWSKGWHEAVEGYFTWRVIPHFGADRIVSTITRAEVEAFRVAQIGTLVRGGKVVSHATVNRMMAALSKFGNWCMVEGREYATANPWAKHPELPEDKVAVPDIGADTVEVILAALEKPPRKRGPKAKKPPIPWRPIFELANETGLRKGELGRLRWEAVRLAERTAWIESTRRHGHTKSREMRPVILTERAVAILEALPRREDGYVLGPIPDPRKAFARAAEAAGLERVWLHLFRHLWAGRLAERGASTAELQATGGWADARMVGKYTAARMERLRQLAESSGAVNGSSGAHRTHTATGAPKGTGG